jgi:hypothetical protein
VAADSTAPATADFARIPALKRNPAKCILVFGKIAQSSRTGWRWRSSVPARSTLAHAFSPYAKTTRWPRTPLVLLAAYSSSDLASTSIRPCSSGHFANDRTKIPNDRIAGCCARTASGHAAVAPPSAAIKSHRLMIPTQADGRTLAHSRYVHRNKKRAPLVRDGSTARITAAQDR